MTSLSLAGDPVEWLYVVIRAIERVETGEWRRQFEKLLRRICKGLFPVQRILRVVFPVSDQF